MLPPARAVVTPLALAVLCACAAGACGGRSDLFVSNARIEAGPLRDGAPPPDAACDQHRIESVPIATLSPVELNMCPADAVLVTFTVSIDACRPLAPVGVSYDSATNTYTLTVFAWDGPTCGRQITLARSVFLSDAGRPKPGLAVVRDGAPGGTATLELPIQPLYDGHCGTANGSGCTSDAQCTASDPLTRCSYDLAECKRLCFDDADCPDSEPRCDYGFCYANEPSCSRFDACSAGQVCVSAGAGAACRPGQTARPGQRCTRDADCGPGALCQCGACLLGCATDADCPSGHCNGARGCAP